MPHAAPTLRDRIALRWRTFLLARAGPRGWRRLAARAACRNLGPYQHRAFLSGILPKGFIDPEAWLNHPRLKMGNHVYLGTRVVITEANSGGPVTIADHVQIYGNAIIETGSGGSIRIDEGTHIQPGLHLHSHLAEIHIGSHVEIAANCAFYNYDHGTTAGTLIMNQALRTRGDIVVGDGVWLGHGVTVLQGVTIGTGAVIAAGAVVVSDIPPNAIAAGIPARVVKFREPAAARREKPLTPTPLP